MRRLRTLALLFTGYFVAAKVGLSFASVNPSATAIWPPTGIALAAFLIWGRGVWPAIFLGAFLANATTNGSIATALGIAAGNTLEGIAGAWLVERLARGRETFNSPQSIFRFVALGALASPTISATVGVTTLSFGGFAPWNDFGSIWWTWWLGDVAGAILFTPLVLTWANPPTRPWKRGDAIQAALLLGVLVGSAAAVFGGVYAPIRNYPIAFLCIPSLVWTAFRFSQRETATAIVVLATVATWGTIIRTGPFVDGPNDQLLLLQAFMCTVAVMVMSIAALVTDQRRLLAAERAARADAEAANAAKDTFLAMLGHELRNPLAAITTAVSVLSRLATLDTKAAHVLEVVERQVAQLARLVDDLLDVTRVTTGKIVLRRSRLELGSLVRRSLETLTATGKTDRHRVEFHGQPAWVDADEARVEQIVTNLVTNALKYTPAGGLIVVTVGVEGDWAILRVEDSGIGIAEAMLPRVFDLFAQGERGAARSEGGLGIGLTLVKRLVELHGGRIEAESSGPGRGSQFTVRLPAASSRRATDSSPAPGEPGKPGRVLVIEDQPDTRDMLRLALQLGGHQVVEAVDGPEGIKAASKQLPDAAVIDVGLPGCDGYEVARQIRKMSNGHRIYMVALTGYGQPEDRRRAEQAGFDLHLVKPVDPATLNALLSNRISLTSS